MDQHIKIVSKTGTKVKMAFHFLTVTEERIKRVYEHCSCDYILPFGNRQIDLFKEVLTLVPHFFQKG